MIFEIGFILILILMNGFFALSEMAIVFSRKPRLKRKADEGSKPHKVALEIAEKQASFLATIQVGISLVSTIAGALGGATVAEGLADILKQVPALASFAGALSLGIVIVITTFFSVVLGELVPKRIALANPERTAAFVSIPMRFVSLIFRPFALLLTASSNVLLRALRLGKPTDPSVTEDEVREMLDQGTEIGVFQESERDMVENILYLGDKRIGAFMTHRTVMPWIPREASIDEAFAVILQNEDFDAFPLCDEGLENIQGLVDARRALAVIAAGAPVTLQELAEEPAYLPETMNAIKALEALNERGTAYAFVVDEYGGIEGFICLRDLAYEILGEVEPAEKGELPGIVKREDGSFFVDGALALDSFVEHFELKIVGSVARNNTVAGAVMTALDKIPQVGDFVRLEGLDIEVADMDGRRIDKVIVKPKQKPEDEEEDQ